MNANSNTYTFLYATAMVIIVAAILSFTAMQLQPMQDKNVRMEKKQDILRAVNIDTSRDAASEVYEKYISGSFVVDSEGKKVDKEAFEVNMKEEMDGPLEERKLPVYLYSHDGQKTYILPLRGKGLWGPIWGYVALEEDFKTIYGATFDHKSETPGLGAEISTREFQEQFFGKQIFNEDGEYIAIEVKKGNADPDALNEVDGISGGTITSKGLQEMVKTGVASYRPYFENKLNNL